VSLQRELSLQNTTIANVAVISVTDVANVDVDIMKTMTSQNTLCGGCWLAIINPVMTCGDQIDYFIKEL
jgi:hypothetical protein